MHVHIPAEVIGGGLSDDTGTLGAHHRDMMLNPLFADELHQLLQVGNLANRDRAQHVEGVGGELTLAHVTANSAVDVIR